MRHVDYTVGDRVKVGENILTFIQTKGQHSFRISGPDEATAKRLKDSPAPKHRKTGRLTERSPKIHRLENSHQNIATLPMTG